MNSILKEKNIDIKIGSKRLCLDANYEWFNSEEKFLDAIAGALNGGVEIVQLRPDGMSDSQYLDVAKKVKQLCGLYNATFAVKSRADIAYLSEADCLLLNQKDIDIRSARDILGENTIIGIYASTITDALFLVKGGVDYVSIPPALSTPTEPVLLTGLEYAKWVSENFSVPVLFEGDIYLNTCLNLSFAPTSRFTVGKPILSAPSPQIAAENFYKVLYP